MHIYYILLCISVTRHFRPRARAPVGARGSRATKAGAALRSVRRAGARAPYAFHKARDSPFARRQRRIRTRPGRPIFAVGSGRPQCTFQALRPRLPAAAAADVTSRLPIRLSRRFPSPLPLCRISTPEQAIILSIQLSVLTTVSPALPRPARSPPPGSPALKSCQHTQPGVSYAPLLSPPLPPPVT